MAVNEPIIISAGIEVTIVQNVDAEKTIIVKEVTPKIITHVAERGTTGPGVPAGGTAGQVLSKVDGTSYNTEWVEPASGGGNGYFPGGWN